MTIESSVDILRTLILTSITLIAPLMATAISVGVLISLLQSITSIQEQTLTFVPKLLAVCFVLIASAHWMIRTLMEFTITFIQKLPEMAR
ncbi:MAG: flagellar biosynthetic protein FliQ [Verrucomicrobia bacterium CG_4_10_14_3_um_filter_43_23]|nr:MAG: flagellar biosynthetic protein FliQ [Verrucomicrobia bacterium CG1_02_43_26]PIP60003.1 MAG: flagellar biosynthetic protein FliQ [Verrucomicrobia bacterium CG22_combo_CG10-13_8_21_14_all_43_17]PIX58306.1 MAG: flagellar biosynthetic protein FliQ [Verrucomicrobia bacterium CG_4_10_14_3_um_filter_43_23]PIY61994.1 MAG: flagellar biosynthetic protein FliQ [Verrucomicrobia bacterium CG_4_10_14_0_8_um_filter_43_34]PJA44028.1 MAG: flagellar biosynthetic protein FliQ [Verrucomicrobia bacterium CG